MTWRKPTGRLTLVPMFIALALLTTATAAPADDRDLLGVSGADPYVFILFDVSGSMNWQPGGDGWAPGAGDDPTSKFYQAKSALFEVLLDDTLGGISWGFATYNQDDLIAYRKHWLYTPLTEPSWVADDRLPYPRPGDPVAFGDDCMDDGDGDTSCDLDTNDVHGTCGAPRDVDSAEKFGELLSMPVTDDDGTTATREWIRHGNRTWELTWSLSSGALGDENVSVDLTLREAHSSCGYYIGEAVTETIAFGPRYTEDADGRPLAGASSFLQWQIDSHVDASGAPAGFFEPDDHYATNTCSGWDGNLDTARDSGSDVALRVATVSDPEARHAWAFDRGDVIPLDWIADDVWHDPSRIAIVERLAPGFDLDSYDPLDSSTFPDFRSAPYFDDHPNSLYNGRLALLPEFAATPPLVPFGSTPIGNSMRDFMDWYDEWEAVAADPETGDPLRDCRTVNLLILTDGDETCYSGNTGGQTDGSGDANPCWIADRLYEESDRRIKTYVVGFGLPESNDNFLSCIADKGRTDAKDYDGDGDLDGPGVILPQNRDELVEALRSVVRAVRADARSFASASVPSLQADVEDKTFLSSFRPVDSASIWDGHVDAFLRPLPLDAEGRPDDSVPCSDDVASECHLWDAGDAIVVQAPTEAEVTAGTYRLGNGTDERRVWYAREASSVPAERLLFEPPINDADRFDLWMGMELPFSIDPNDPEYAAAEARATAAIGYSLRQKVEEIDAKDGGTETVTYVLGDIFHSKPAFQSQPKRYDYWVADLFGNGAACDDTSNPNRGYRCFWERHRYRRKMLVLGANDGQIHGVDAGMFQGSVTNGVVEGAFDNGTGQELFGWVPRAILPTVVGLAEQPDHQWTVDGTVQADDVFIDPIHDGAPTPGEREWRTVVLGGLREGGSAYFALDLTQPDTLDNDNLPQPLAGGRVPSCTDGGGDCGPLPFPALLWELSDERDEDANGYPDLGDTWSIPNLGRIRVCGGATCDEASNPNDLEDRFVAVVGGGMDPEGLGQTGNFLYMIDIETGTILYKRPLQGSAPSEPAAVDTDQDGYLDTVYIGTTEGLMYKAVISSPALVETFLESDGRSTERILDAAWDPFPIFVAGDVTEAPLAPQTSPAQPFAQGAGPLGPRVRVEICHLPPGRPEKCKTKKVGETAVQAHLDHGDYRGECLPGCALPDDDGGGDDGGGDDGGGGGVVTVAAGQGIFYPPAVIFVAELGRYAIAFGTGERGDLWQPTDAQGRFYMILDEGFAADDNSLPLDESSYEEVPTVGQEEAGSDVLLAPSLGNRPGWFMKLDLEERMLTKTFALAGITVFSAYRPEIVTDADLAETACAKSGESRVFVVKTTSGNGVITEDGSRTRYWTVDDFVTDPFTEPGVTKNPGSGNGGGDPMPPDLVALRAELEELFPDDCQFANYTIDLKTLRSDTGVFFIAPIPVCLVERNFKEF